MKSLIRRAKKRDSAAIESLFLALEPRFYHMYSMVNDGAVDRNDCRSVARFAVYSACESWDETRSRGNSPDNFLVMHTMNSFRDFVRSTLRTKIPSPVSLDPATGMCFHSNDTESFWNEEDLGFTFVDPTDGMDLPKIVKVLRDGIDRMPTGRKRILNSFLTMKLRDPDMSVTEIASRIGVQKQTVDQYVSKYLRRYLAPCRELI